MALMFLLSVRDRGSPMRVDAQHSAGVVAHPERSKADGQPHGRTAQREACRRSGPYARLIRTIAFASRSATHTEPKPTATPIGAVRPGDGSTRSVRPAVDAQDRASAVTARRADRSLVGRQERTRLCRSGILAARLVAGVDPDDRLVRQAHPNRPGACRHRHVVGTARTHGSDRDRRHDLVRRRVDPGDAGTAFVRDPDRTRRRRNPLRFGADRNGSTPASRCGIDAQDAVVGHACDPERAVAGRGLAAAPRQVRAGIVRAEASCGRRRCSSPGRSASSIGTASLVDPDGSLPHGESPRVRGDRDLRHDRADPDAPHLAAAEPCATTTPTHWPVRNATSAVMRTRLVVFMLPPSSRVASAQAIEAPAGARAFGDHPGIGAGRGKTLSLRRRVSSSAGSAARARCRR